MILLISQVGRKTRYIMRRKKNSKTFANIVVIFANVISNQLLYFLINSNAFYSLTQSFIEINFSFDIKVSFKNEYSFQILSQTKYIQVMIFHTLYGYNSLKVKLRKNLAYHIVVLRRFHP